MKKVTVNIFGHPHECEVLNKGLLRWDKIGDPRIYYQLKNNAGHEFLQLASKCTEVVQKELSYEIY